MAKARPAPDVVFGFGQSWLLYGIYMSKFYEIHPQNPQPRAIAQAVQVVNQGGIIVYPTDSGYAIGCQLANKAATERISRLRHLDQKHNFSLLCQDLSQLAQYAKVDNQAYRFIKSHTPGAYTFIFEASSNVPKRLAQSKKKTIGIRVPDNQICQVLLAQLGEPLVTSSLEIPDAELEVGDAYHVYSMVEHDIDLMLAGGAISLEPTTVIDMCGEYPQIVRQGRGAIDWQ